MLVVVQYESPDPEAFLAQNAGNGSPAAASDDAFAVLAVASLAAWLDVLEAAASFAARDGSAAVLPGHPERTAAE